VTQEFQISVTPVGEDNYFVRVERVERGVPLAEEQVTWAVPDWLAQASLLMNDPLEGLLRGETVALLQGERSSKLITPSQPLPPNLVAFGQHLYNSLFQGSIRDSWMTARGIAQNRQQMLRLRLGLKDGQLLRLPWEVMHEGDRPIATGTDFVFSRYHSRYANLPPAAAPIATDQPLKILMVLAAPTDQVVLALRQEALHLQTELQGLSARDQRSRPIELTILEQPGREQLTQALEHQHFQVFHYAGHSSLGTSGGNLYLVNRRTGLTETLSGDDFAGLLVNNGIQMAVFNSCRGVHTAADNPESGAGNLAEALVKRGVPAVLAMAERIPDDVALNLSRLFYRSLRQAYAIDLSLSRARQSLISSYGSHQLYWALPILYLHPQFDGYLQPDQANDRAATAGLPIGAIAAIDPSSVNPSNINGQFQSSNLAQNGKVDDFDPFDPDELEFDDPDYAADDLQGVAALVHQLSHGVAMDTEDDHPLNAPPNENLLPEAEPSQPFLDLPENPEFTVPLPFTEAPSITSVVATPVTTESPAIEKSLVPIGDAETSAEIEQVLAEAGKLTPAIAAAIQTIRLQPDNPQAYSQLGSELQQAGYLTEAIAFFQQALHLDPTLAEIHNQLGEAQLQQGNVAEAISAFNQAIELNPKLTQALDHLSQCLSQQSGNHSSKPVQPGLSTRLKVPQKPLLWLATIAIAASIVTAVWLSRDPLTRPPIPWLQFSPLLDPNTTDLQKVSTKIVAALATDQLNQGNVAGAKRAVETLLDRNANAEAVAVLTPVLNKYTDNATINFLIGRAVWQSAKANIKGFSSIDARRYWETAAKLKPDLTVQNALGFAYYEEGEFDRARRAWENALYSLGIGDLSGETEAATSTNPEALLAYTGIALAQMKLAENETPSRKVTLLSQALKLRQQVLTADPINFQPNALAKNWLWSAKAIRDWQTLLTIQSAS
jgi:tetratricopeptide (TPR) repeat protein